MIITQEQGSKLKEYWEEKKEEGLYSDYLYIKNYKTLSEIMEFPNQGGHQKRCILKGLMKWIDYEHGKRHGYKIYHIYNAPFVDGFLELERIKKDLDNNKDLLFLTYYDFCQYLKIPCNRKEKSQQLKSISNFIDYKKQSNERFKINGVKFSIVEKRNEIFKYIPYPDYYNKSGIYKIETENKIYIGSTVDLYGRYWEHFSTKINPHTNKMLNEENGQFVILQSWDNIDIKELREYELEVIKEYQDKIKNNIINKQLINVLLVNDDGSLYMSVDNRKYNKKAKPKIHFSINIENKDIVEKLLKDNNIEYRVLHKKQKKENNKDGNNE